ncbi:hypothetical protein ABT082_17020, partial [Streptomyces massasporeus]
PTAVRHVLVVQLAVLRARAADGVEGLVDVVTERPDGEIEMTGPAVIVAEGEIDADWLESATSA